MLLVIDNTKEGPSTRSAAAARYGASKITLSLLLNNKLVQRVFKTGRNVNPIICLEKLLSGRKISLKDIKYLGVVVGAGRFTATRLAVTFANTLSFALKIPVFGLTENFYHDSAGSLLKKAQTAKVGQYVIASYSGEPRMGGAKQFLNF